MLCRVVPSEEDDDDVERIDMSRVEINGIRPRIYADFRDQVRMAFLSVILFVETIYRDIGVVIRYVILRAHHRPITYILATRDKPAEHLREIIFKS